MNRDILASELEDIAQMLRDDRVVELWTLPDELRSIARQIEIAIMATKVIHLQDYMQ